MADDAGAAAGDDDAPAAATRFATCSDIPFTRLVKLFEHCKDSSARNRRQNKRMLQLRAFRLGCVNRTSDDIFEVYRLLLPKVRLGLGAMDGSLRPPGGWMLAGAGCRAGDPGWVEPAGDGRSQGDRSSRPLWVQSTPPGRSSAAPSAHTHTGWDQVMARICALPGFGWGCGAPSARHVTAQRPVQRSFLNRAAEVTDCGGGSILPEGYTIPSSGSWE